MKTKQDIMQLIEEEDVEFIRLQFADIFGNLKNIAVTPGQMERVVTGLYPIEGTVLFDDKFDPGMDLFLCPDYDTFVTLPWRPQQSKVCKIICDVCDRNGKPFYMSPRTILKNVVKAAADKGYTVMVEPEIEFFLFHTDDNGIPTTITHERAGYLDVGPVDLGENVRRDMVLTLEEMGFEIQSSHHEMAPAQHEIDFEGGEALQTADDIMTFKFAIRSIAKRFGLHATFMPKPRADMAGSGMHLKMALVKDGKNLFAGRDEEQMPEIAENFMAGVIHYASEMSVLTNPLVNSYKRILSGYQAPSRADWCMTGEETALKYKNFCGDARVEARFPDPAANPYLAIAACIVAGIKGIEEGEKSGKAMNSMAKKLPQNLKDALGVMKKGTLVKEILGAELADIYYDIKLKEWNDYMIQVSDWEVEHYLTKM